VENQGTYPRVPALLPGDENAAVVRKDTTAAVGGRQETGSQTFVGRAKDIAKINEDAGAVFLLPKPLVKYLYQIICCPIFI
jgi:hypothetical protein